LTDVLVVDDNADICLVLGRLLARCGFTSHCAFGGREALAFLQTTTPKLVILDYMMPDLDGLEVLRQIRADANINKLPVVIFSALDDPKFCDYATSVGANACWTKTRIDGSNLREHVLRYIGNDDNVQ